MRRVQALEILGVGEGASDAEIKRAYRRAAMKAHPDAKGGTQAGFLEVYSAYEKLTGQPESTEAPAGITKEAYEQFRAGYEGSAEEKAELVDLYQKFKGNLAKVIDSMLLGRDEDEPRLRGILDQLITSGDLERFPAYRKKVLADRRRQARREREAAEAEEWARKSGLDKESLEDRLSDRAKKWSRFLEDLEEKAASGRGRKAKGKGKGLKGKEPN